MILFFAPNLDGKITRAVFLIQFPVTYNYLIITRIWCLETSSFQNFLSYDFKLGNKVIKKIVCLIQLSGDVHLEP